MPNRITNTSSSVDNDQFHDVQQQHYSQDSDLGRLSRLSANAVKLNQIHHIKICATYDKNGDGTTIYVMNVYLRYVQKGLPPPSVFQGESLKEQRKRLKIERERERSMYQVEHRYSAFRELRRRVMKSVNAQGEDKYHHQCSYCSRVKFIDSSTIFPPRVPNRGFLASCTGWRQICTYFRKRQLERFVNQMLWAAKDMSYRTGSGRCDRFLLVSEILNSFLSAASMEATENVW
ncbi:hypothetical protein KXD40_000926 [Peronospora effusa]|uniref:PX domain-containing protein n=1 Tax=Peronospora effusa TaxID=542832 RepID=A0A3M6VQ27_9STRA|nr:hypothetical protein DD238_005901 [Peronospora effusa]RQM11223.1 hypothetical protein DD237_004889 [Peronospora effusa]UIZ21024.1 hypothetical protein KXD40_000926 [Peronospora effusa]